MGAQILKRIPCAVDRTLQQRGLGIACLCTFALIGSCSAGPSQIRKTRAQGSLPASSTQVLAHQVNAPSEDPVDNYVTPFANSQHNSRVAMPTFLPRSLDLVADFGGKIVRDKPPHPTFVLASPGGKHIAVVMDPMIPELVHFTGAGAPESFRSYSSEGTFSYYFTSGGFWDGDRLDPWLPGPSILRKPDVEEDGVNAVWTDGEHWVQISEVLSSENSRPGLNIIRFTRAGTTSLGWIEATPVAACITALGVGAILTGGSDLMAYAPSSLASPTSKESPIFRKALLDSSLGTPYTVSALNGGFGVVRADSSTNSPTLYSLVVDPWQIKTRWSSVVLMVDGEGRQMWQAHIPWGIRQPPIDGGEGRVIVAGDGIACIVDGEEKWRTDGGLVRATAFGDGAIAITIGPSLKILDSEGKPVCSLETPNQEILETPPAIASDGSIWVASATHLYVAR
jgi:hypothetical protein